MTWQAAFKRIFFLIPIVILSACSHYAGHYPSRYVYGARYNEYRHYPQYYENDYARHSPIVVEYRDGSHNRRSRVKQSRVMPQPSKHSKYFRYDDRKFDRSRQPKPSKHSKYTNSNRRVEKHRKTVGEYQPSGKHSKYRYDDRRSNNKHQKMSREHQYQQPEKHYSRDDLTTNKHSKVPTTRPLPNPSYGKATKGKQTYQQNRPSFRQEPYPRQRSGKHSKGR